MALANANLINYWPDNACARAFWGQHEIPPYQELLAHTRAWLDPQPGERWLDLGCGSGQLTRALWERSQGQIGQVIALDCAAVNERAYEKLRTQLQPPSAAEQIAFICATFAEGLPTLATNAFDGVVCGLALQYAESHSTDLGRWTTAGYDEALAHVCRVLKPGGQFLFSVNVPNPSWARVAAGSLRGVFHTPNPGRYLKRCLRMMSYGRWLTQQSQCGRFHYLPLEAIVEKLQNLGFEAIEHRRSYARQAYLIRCQKRA